MAGKWQGNCREIAGKWHGNCRVASGRVGVGLASHPVASVWVWCRIRSLVSHRTIPLSTGVPRGRSSCPLVSHWCHISSKCVVLLVSVLFKKGAPPGFNFCNFSYEKVTTYQV